MGNSNIKVLIEILLASVSAWFGTLLYLMCALFLVEIIDYITGIWAAHIRGEKITSDISYAGIARKISQWLLVCVGGILDFLASKLIDGSSTYMACLVITWIVINEILSIFENMDDIGLPIPSFVRKLTQRLKDTVEEDCEKDALKEDCEKDALKEDGNKNSASEAAQYLKLRSELIRLAQSMGGINEQEK